MHPAQFLSPGRYGPSRTSALRAPSSTSSGLKANFSVFQPSQIPLPERSIFSLSQSSNPSHLSSSPYYSSVLRRPTDRFRNLIGTQSSFMTGSSPFANVTQNVSSETNTGAPPILPTREKKFNLNSSLSTQGMQKVNINPASEKMVSQDVSDFPEQLETHERNSNVDDVANISRTHQNPHQVSTLNPSSKNEVQGSTNKNLVSNSAINVVEPGASGSNAEQLSVQSLPSHDKIPSTHTPEQISVLALKDALPVPLPETEQPTVGLEPSSSVQPCPSPHLEKEKLIPHHSTSINQPNQIPIISSEAKQSPKQQKANFVDTTLNEVSTLSSSPGVSSTHAGSVKANSTSGIAVLHNEGDKEALKHTSTFLPTLLQHIETESNILGRASHLLNTSLSSIENSEKKVSAGSGGKGTDDDDDFW